MLLRMFVYKFLCGDMFSVLMGVYLGVGSLDLIVTLCFEGLSNFSKVVAPFHIPTSGA